MYEDGGAANRGSLCVAWLLVWSAMALGQHGTAPTGYWPLGYNGDTWTGEGTHLDDATRQITLSYRKGDKSESFVGVLKDGYKVKRKDGSEHELKVSEIPLGSRLTVYYNIRTRKVGGKKEKYNEIISLSRAPDGGK